jgi:small subunit ribosomal protein S3
MWFAKQGYADYLKEDLMIRKYLKSRLANSGVSKVTIERQKDKVDLAVYTSKPGMVIGKSGQQVNQLRDEIKHLTSKEVTIDIKSVENPDLDAQLVADQLAKQLEMRVSFRRAMKRTLANTMRSGAKGIKILCKGRLGGAEMARREQYREGRVPLHTLRADIDYAVSTAVTTFGTIGVKTWIFKGEILSAEEESAPSRRF